MSNDIHPLAQVSDKATLGKGNDIGAFVVIEDDVVIGDNNKLFSGAVLRSGSRLGNGNTIHEYVVIGGLPQDLGFNPETKTFVEIGNNNTLRESVTVNRATKENSATKLGDNNYLMTQVHLGHDCQLGNNIVIAPSTGLGGHVMVEDRAFISGGVMVHQFVRIGSFAMLAGNAKITQDVLPYMTIDGNPAHIVGLNKVGLRRAGVTAADMAVVKKAYQLIFDNNHPLSDRLEHVAKLNNSYATHLTDFIHSSKRSFHRNKA